MLAHLKSTEVCNFSLKLFLVIYTIYSSMGGRCGVVGKMELNYILVVVACYGAVLCSADPTLSKKLTLLIQPENLCCSYSWLCIVVSKKVVHYHDGNVSKVQLCSVYYFQHNSENSRPLKLHRFCLELKLWYTQRCSDSHVRIVQ